MRGLRCSLRDWERSAGGGASWKKIPSSCSMLGHVHVFFTPANKIKGKHSWVLQEQWSRSFMGSKFNKCIRQAWEDSPCPVTFASKEASVTFLLSSDSTFFWLCFSALLFFPSPHFVGSLTSKHPSMKQLEKFSEEFEERTVCKTNSENQAARFQQLLVPQLEMQ